MLKRISNLPDPRHVLSKIIPSTIATANTEVMNMHSSKLKRVPYSRFHLRGANFANHKMWHRQSWGSYFMKVIYYILLVTFTKK